MSMTKTGKKGEFGLKGTNLKDVYFIKIKYYVRDRYS